MFKFAVLLLSISVFINTQNLKNQSLYQSTTTSLTSRLHPNQDIMETLTRLLK